MKRVDQQRQTRERMLRAAESVFARHGYAAATVESIADVAGHTRSAVYKVLGGKQAIFLACAERRSDELLAEWRLGIQRAKTDEQCLRALADVLAADVHGPDGWSRAMTEFGVAVADGPLVERVRVLQDEVDGRVADLIDTLCRRIAAEPPLPVKELAILVVSLANGLLARAQQDPSFDSTRALTEGLHLLLCSEPLRLDARASSASRTKATSSR